jgi:hypothetical protein
MDARGAHFTLRVRRLGGRRPWHTFITHGFAQLGEPGSTTYGARTAEASARKAMRTVAAIATARHLPTITVEFAIEDDGWAERGEPRPEPSDA